MYNIKDKYSYCDDTNWFLKTCFAITILQEKRYVTKTRQVWLQNHISIGYWSEPMMCQWSQTIHWFLKYNINKIFKTDYGPRQVNEPMDFAGMCLTRTRQKTILADFNRTGHLFVTTAITFSWLSDTTWVYLCIYFCDVEATSIVFTAYDYPVVIYISEFLFHFCCPLNTKLFIIACLLTSRWKNVIWSLTVT